MFDIKEISKYMSVAICAALFGSTMILSAVGPAAHAETSGRIAPATAGSHAPVTMRYMA